MGIIWDLGLGILLNIIFRSWDMNEIADFFGDFMGFHENLKWDMHVGKIIKHIPQSSPCWWYNLTIPGGKNM